MKKIVFQTDSVTFQATLNDSLTAQEIFAQLPVESKVSRWGQEIYCDLGFKASAEGATMELQSGDIAYWSQGKCLCVFFGPTPASNDQTPVPASPVVIIGTTAHSPHELGQITLGEKITVRAAT